MLLLAFLFPFWSSKFQTYLVTQVIIYSILGISYYLLLGHTGLLSFGHAAFFGIGAYTPRPSPSFTCRPCAARAPSLSSSAPFRGCCAVCSLVS